MRSPVESSTDLTPYEVAFAEYLSLTEDGDADFDVFCAERPGLATDLRRLHARWRAFDEAVSADLSPDLLQRQDAAEESAEHLLCDLPRDDADSSRYHQRGEVGRGGMGRVVKVWDRYLRRSLAMKVLFEGRRKDARSLARFLDEAMITGQLEHPGIVPVYELGLDAGGRVYFTMPLVRGDDLQTIIERVHAGHSDWTRDRVLEVLLRVCEAVGYAHARGVVHRDLKPTNVMVGPFGETYVMDWGLARLLDLEGREKTPSPAGADASSDGLSTVRSDQRLDDASALSTHVGDVVGTPVYMSPEQAHGWIEHVGPASDVYSIGAMLYHLLTGFRPYLSPGERTSAEDVIRAVRTRAPRPIHILDPSAPSELEAICDKAMAREPERRYASTMAVAEELRAYLDGRVVRSYRTGSVAELVKWVQRNRRFAAALVAAALFLVTGFVISTALFLDSRRNEQEARSQQVRADDNALELASELRARTIQQARLFGRTGDFANAEDLLWLEFLRDVEDLEARWGLWELYARDPLMEARHAHSMGPGPMRMRGMALAPDGSFLVTAADDGDMHIWDSYSHRRVATLSDDPGQRWSIAVHPGGRLLAATRPDGSIGIWDLVSERMVRTRTVGVRPTRVLFDPNGERLAVGDSSGEVRYWNMASDSVSAPVGAGPGPVWDMAFHPDGGLLAATGGGDRVRVLREGEPAAELMTGGPAGVGVAFSPDGSLLACGAREGRVVIWDSQTLEEVAAFSTECGVVRRLTFGPDGQSLACVGWYTVEIWDLAKLAVTRSFPSKRGAWGVEFLPDGRTVAEASEDGHLRFWTLSTNEWTRDIPPEEGWRMADFSPDGTRFASVDRSGRVRVWDSETGELLVSHSLSAQRLVGVYLLGDGTRAAVGHGGMVEVLDLETGDVLQSFSGLEMTTVQCLDTHGERLVFAREDGTFAIHDARDGALLAELGEPALEAVAVCFAPDGETLVTLNRQGRARRWAGDGRLLAEIRSGVESSWAIAFNADGSRVAFPSWLRTVAVLTADLSEQCSVLRGHRGIVWSADWSPTMPNVIASVADDGTVRLWDAEAGRELLEIQAFSGGGELFVRFAPDGRSLMASKTDGEARIFDLEYFERHIAANLRHQLERMEPLLPRSVDPELARRWAEGVLARPWPRFAR